MSVLDILLIVAGVGYILVRRLIGDLLEVKGLLILPAVLTIIGLFQLRKVQPVSVDAVLFAAIGIAVSIVLGLIRGTTIHLGERDGHLWMRYRGVSVGLWLLNFAVKGALIPVEMGMSKPAANAADHAILISIGLGIFAENAVVILRAMRSKSHVVWEKAEDGSFRSHAGFDRARDWVNEGFAGQGAPSGKRLRWPDRDW